MTTHQQGLAAKSGGTIHNMWDEEQARKVGSRGDDGGFGWDKKLDGKLRG